MTHTTEHRRITANGVALHYAVAGEGPPLVLIHGFPQCWHQWRPIIDRLASKFRIIAPNLRGLGGSPGPISGYDKHSLAEDVRAIVLAECGDIPALICGHDMGSFVAFAYALKYRDKVAGLMLVDAPPPGTGIWDAGAGSPRAWHIGFHAQIDVALMLVTGRERAYISQFIASRAYDQTAVSQADIDVYAAVYSEPGALRAAFSMYAALQSEDPALNCAELSAHGKLDMPVLLVGGAMTMPKAALQMAADEIATNPEVEVVERAGHWIAEEQPEELSRLIVKLSDRRARSVSA